VARKLDIPEQVERRCQHHRGEPDICWRTAFQCLERHLWVEPPVVVDPHAKSLHGQESSTANRPCPAHKQGNSGVRNLPGPCGASQILDSINDKIRSV
jgi:hypothetical protein